MNKSISYRSVELINALIIQKKDFFTLKNAAEILHGKDNTTVRRLLTDMTKRGLIMRIKEGLYHRIPYEQNPDQYFPNWHLTASAMLQSKDFYIGFYSALDIYGLITQPSLVEQVVTREQIKPKTQLVKNIRFEFIKLSKHHFFGYKNQWIDDFHKVNCSDLEKTFLDCLFIPNYAGGIAEITKALYKSREKLQSNIFKDYLKKYNTQAVYKRLGFLLDQLGMFLKLQDFIKGMISSSYTPLDPSLPKLGYYSSKWSIIDNLDIKSVIDSIKT